MLGGVAWLTSIPEPLFQTQPGLLVLDSTGGVLDARVAPDDQWRFAAKAAARDDLTPRGMTPVPERYAAALLHFEDRRFYGHLGFDLGAIARAIVQNLSSGTVVSGASTIPMQVVRLSREGRPRVLGEKLTELFMATRLESLYSKEEILRLYADNAPFGGNIVGLEAASRRYFGRAPDDLSWAEAALLAVLPNNPSQLRIDANRPALLARRDRLLHSMADAGIIDAVSRDSALLEPLPGEDYEAPRNVPGLVSHLLSAFPDEPTVQTTIDGDLQQALVQTARTHARNLLAQEVKNLAILVVDLEGNEVIAYLGNTPLEDPSILGREVDIVRAPRSTGSILKPFLYAAMLDSGEMLPTELLPDIPIRYGSYSPQNHTHEYLGAIPANQALARSLNIPFVGALADFGLPRFKQLLEELGMTTLTRAAQDYGLPLILGGGEGSLWEIVSMYAGLTRHALGFSNPVAEMSAPRLLFQGDFPEGRPAPISRQAWYLTLKVLQEVNRPGIDSAWQRFSSGSPIAWKTGTSQGFRDAWAVGVSPRYAVGVWAGNAQGPGTAGLRGTFSAAPVLFDVFRLLGYQEDFPRPPGLVRLGVSSDSGFLPLPGDSDLVYVDALPASERSGRISPYHEPGPRPAFVLPPAMGYYYSLWNLDYAPPPAREASPLGILVPQAGAIFLLPRDYAGQDQPAVFEAFHRDPEEVLYWHLDDEYLGRTFGEHRISVRPSPGSHRLVIVDSLGSRAERVFSVRLSEASDGSGRP